VSNDIAKRVAEVIGLPAPSPDPTFYNNNRTAFVTIFNNSLPTIATLKVGVLASVKSASSLSQAAALTRAFSSSGVNTIIVGEALTAGINQTYSSADATGFDGIIVAAGAESLFTSGTSSTFFPADRPLQILTDGYRWGKPVGVLGNSSVALKLAGVTTKLGVFKGASSGNLSAFVTAFEEGLKTFKFIDRFPVDL
jgi:catalase